MIVICVNYKLVLIMGTYHLPQQELNHMLLQLLIFNTLWKEFRVESRSRHFVFGTKTGRTSLQVVGYFLELILWASFLYLLISRKALTFFTVITVSCDQQKLQKNSNIYIYIYVCVCVCVCVCLNTSIPLLPKSYIYWPSPPSSLEQFLRATWGAVFQAAVLICLPIKLNLQYSLFSLFFLSLATRNQKCTLIWIFLTSGAGLTGCTQVEMKSTITLILHNTHKLIQGR